jgi:hypothetical protein
MFDFQEFTEAAQKDIGNYLPDVDIEEVRIAKVNKVNMELTGIVIMREGENTSPNIYLEGFYEDYRRGRSLEDVFSDIADTYIRSYQEIPKVSIVSDFSNREYILNNVYMAIMNKEQNEGMLSEVPYKEIEGMPDVVGIYRVRVNAPDSDNIASYRLSGFNLEQASITADELEQVAMENTKRMFPQVVKNLNDVLSEHSNGMPTPQGANSLYVITNDCGIYGATAVLYEDELSEFAESVGHNLILLPSSVHEFVAMLDDGTVNVNDMCEVVQSVNMTVLNLSERLSNNVFYYDKDAREYSQLTHIDRKLDCVDDAYMDKSLFTK